MSLFYLLIAVLPLEEHWFWRKELFGSFTIVKALGVLCFLIALGRILTRHAVPELFRGSVTRWYCGLLVVQCASYFVHRGDAAIDLSLYWHVASVVMLLVTTITLIDSPAGLFRTLLMAISGVGFASLYTIRGQQLAGGGDVRPSGIFADANYYALVVGLWIPLAFLWSFQLRKKWQRVLCAACFASMLLGSAFAASRGGALGLAAAFLFLIWHSRNRLRNLLVLAALVAPLLLYSSSSLLSRFLNPGYGDIKAQEARVIAWKAGLRMIQAHPLTGIGMGNFESLVERYEDSDERVISVAHNTYIEAAAELGLPGFLAHISVLAASFFTVGGVRRRTRASGQNQFSVLALGLQAGLMSYLVSAVFVSTWWQNEVWLFLFLSACIERLSRGSAVVRSVKKLEPANELQVVCS